MARVPNMAHSKISLESGKFFWHTSFTAVPIFYFLCPTSVSI